MRPPILSVLTGRHRHLYMEDRQHTLNPSLVKGKHHRAQQESHQDYRNHLHMWKVRAERLLRSIAVHRPHPSGHQPQCQVCASLVLEGHLLHLAIRSLAAMAPVLQPLLRSAPQDRHLCRVLLRMLLPHAAALHPLAIMVSPRHQMPTGDKGAHTLCPLDHLRSHLGLRHHLRQELRVHNQVAHNQHGCPRLRVQQL